MNGRVDTTTGLSGDFFQRLARPPASQDPHRQLAALRQPGLTRLATGELVLGRHDDVDASLRDQRFARAAFPAPPVKAVQTLAKMFLLVDPPDHTRLRAVVAPYFTASAVKQRRDEIDGEMSRLLAEVLAAEAVRTGRPVDVVNELAYPLSLRVIGRWLGVAGEVEADLGRWSRQLTAAIDAPVPSSLRHVPLYVRAVLTRQARPIALFRLASRLVATANAALDTPTDDAELLGLLTAAQADGTMSRDEAAATWVLLVIAGHETSANLIANTLWLLLTHRDQLDKVVADPSLISAAVDESLRLEPVVPTTARVATEDVELPSGRVAAGTTVVCSLAAANRDPDVFSDPDAFDIERSQHGNLGFGRGIHHCLGLHIARAEAEIALGQLLALQPEVAGEVRWRDTFGTRGLVTLPVRFRARATR